MLLRLFHHDATACASYLFGCTTHDTLAVVDPHVDLVDSYIEAADRAGSPIVGGFRDPRPGRPRVRPAGVGRTHRCDSLPARRSRRRVRPRSRSPIDSGSSSATPS